MPRAGKPRLGQHFLRAPAVLDAILAAAELHPGDKVLEIGPGHGVLTHPMCEAVGPEGKVLAVEFDANLAKQLRIDRPECLQILQGDAVTTPWADHAPFDAIVSNLPYQISGPITSQFLDLLRTHPWRTCVLLVQKEFGVRVAAGHGSKQYGRLSVYASRWCDVKAIRKVPPGCFDPPPDVDSVVIQLTPRTPLEVGDEVLWHRLVDAAFAQRRKMLRNTVPPIAANKDQAVAILEEAGLANLRPEQVSPQQFAELCQRLVKA